MCKTPIVCPINCLLVLTTLLGLTSGFTPGIRSSLTYGHPGGLCRTGLDCLDENTRCISQSWDISKCQCLPDYLYDRKINKCVKPKPIGEHCGSHLECQANDKHSLCDFKQTILRGKSFCSCSSRFIFDPVTQQCVHCKALSGCNDEAYLNSHKFTFLAKTVLIVTGFFFLFSLLMCFLAIRFDIYHNRHTRGRDFRLFTASPEHYENSNYFDYNQSQEDPSLLFTQTSDKPPTYEEAIASTGPQKSNQAHDVMVSVTQSKNLTSHNFV